MGSAIGDAHVVADNVRLVLERENRSLRPIPGIPKKNWRLRNVSGGGRRGAGVGRGRAAVFVNRPCRPPRREFR